jgi:hypothetical protein
VGFLEPKDDKDQTAWDYGWTIIQLLRGLREDVQQGRGDDGERRRIPFNIALDATGVGSLEVQVPRGKSWQLRAYGLSTSAANGIVSFWANEAGGTNLLLTTTMAGLLASGLFYEGEILTEDDVKLVIQVSAGPVNGNISGNIRVQQFDGNPHSPLRVVS